MFANVERERERERLVQAHQSKHSIGGLTSREREREREMCVCVLFEFRPGNLSTYFKVGVDLCKKNVNVRGVLRFQFLSTILTGFGE